MGIIGLSWKERLDLLRMQVLYGLHIQVKGPHMPSEEFRAIYGRIDAYAEPVDVWQLLADLEKEIEILQLEGLANEWQKPADWPLFNANHET